MTDSRLGINKELNEIMVKKKNSITSLLKEREYENEFQ
jgi:hypothetical protein